MKPLSLKIKNFMSHTQSEIDFSKFSSALIIGAYDNNLEQSNGSGKSVILDGIMWAMFGKSRHKKKDGVIKNGCKYCKVEFVFETNNLIYKITRKRDCVAGEAEVILEQQEPDQSFKNISADTNTATDRSIEEIIGVSADVFLNSVYFQQNDISMFAEAPPGKRKDILKDLLKIHIWDSYKKIADDRSKKLKTQLDEKNAVLEDIASLQQLIIASILKMDGFKENMVLLDSKINSVSNKLFNKKSELNNLYNGPNSILEEFKQLERDEQKALKRLEQIDVSLKENQEFIQKNKEAATKFKSKIQELNAKILLKKDINLDKLRNQLIQGKTKEKILKNSIALLGENIEVNMSCESCFRPINKKDVPEIAKNRKQKLLEEKERLTKIKKMITDAEQAVKNKEQILDDGNAAEIEKSKILARVSKLEAEVSNKNSEKEQLIKDKNFIINQNYSERLNELKKTLNKDTHSSLDLEVKDLENEIKNIKTNRDNLNIELGRTEAYKNSLLEKEQLQIKLRDQISDLRKEWIVYDRLKTYFGKDGIQALIIENVSGELEDYTNEVLSQISNEATTIKIKTQKQNDNGSWSETLDLEITMGNRTDDFDTFSGGEKFRISLALRLALGKILSNRMGGNLQFLLLDEVSSSLDSKGLKMFIDIVKALSATMKVLVITHDDRLKEFFEDIIMVNKDSSGSKAVLVS